MTEWHSGRKQTAKVIIICGHAAPHLTDGDNMSKHFSIKKREHKQTDGERKHARAHKRLASKDKKKKENEEMTSRSWYLIKNDAASLQTG